MNLNLTKSFLESIITNDDIIKIKNSLTETGYNDMLKDYGYEHYKLFMGISKQLSNIKILEIGTHHGNSAICFSFGNYYNNNNKIDTYDITNMIQENPKENFKNMNISYFLQNILNENYCDNNKDYLLSFDIIFIDIDPHEGLLEYDMYLWLKKNNYQGIIIYDDIKLGLNHEANSTRATQHSMIDFWNKIDKEFKIDISNVGHISGTGLINFNKNNNIIY